MSKALAQKEAEKKTVAAATHKGKGPPTQAAINEQVKFAAAGYPT